MASAERFLIYDIDLPDMSRKRIYDADMTNESFEVCLEELMELKALPKIFSVTKAHLEKMIFGLKTLPVGQDSCDWKNILIGRIYHQETTLQWRLSRDQKYAVLLESFHKLRACELAQRLILRYGNYHRIRPSLIERKAVELSREKRINKVVLANMTWKQVLEHIEKENKKNGRHTIHKFLRHYHVPAFPDKTLMPMLDELPGPFTALIETLCELCDIKFARAIAEIERFLQQDGSFNSCIAQAIADKDWYEVATIIEQDLQAVNDDLGSDEEFREEMFEAIRAVKRRYFSEIRTTINGHTGLKIAMKLDFSTEVLATQRSEHIARVNGEIKPMGSDYALPIRTRFVDI